ncbi:MAG: DUF4082 domain-containing protein [Planctomycetia bacterium]|nr:DUF4082 domain-containing protein [Planctomycetia bacterium]
MEELEARDVPATYTLFDTSVAPDAQTASSDTSAVTLGVEFTVETTGIVDYISFYRAVAIDSGYTVSLWEADGTLLADGIVIEGQGPTPGWQKVYIGNVTVNPGETYVAAYHASQGGYSYSYDYFDGTGIDAGPLDAEPSDEFGPNGVYIYGSNSVTLPTQSYRASNYWVTPVFTTSDQLPTVTAISPGRGPTTGDQFVEITGTNFTAGGTPRVFFGDVEGTVTSSTNTRIFVQTPTHSAGVVDVRVRTSLGTSTNTSADNYTYYTPLAAPTGVIATAGTDRVTISWEPVAGATGYNVYVPRGEGLVRIGSNVTGTTLIDTDVVAGTTYGYSVSALSGSDEGIRSEQAFATPGPSPANLTATPQPGRSIRVEWDSVSGAISYNLYRGTTSGELTLIVSGNTSTFWNDVNGEAGLTPGQTYYYQVAAVFNSSPHGQGPRSNEVSATLPYPAGTYSVWSNSATPTNAVDPDTEPVEVGVRFSVDAAGELLAIRFYRGVAIDSGYTVHLWDEDGNLLGSGSVIEGQSSTPGWQTVYLNSPVTLQTGKTYIASYYASEGGYAADELGLTDGIESGPINLLPSDSNGGNGVYRYGTGGGFPTLTYQDTNYWVDMLYRIN